MPNTISGADRADKSVAIAHLQKELSKFDDLCYQLASLGLTPDEIRGLPISADLVSAIISKHRGLGLNKEESPMPCADVAAFFLCASDSFGQIAAAARVIVEKTERHTDENKLAELIVYLANDMDNVVGSWGEDVDRKGVRND